MFFFFFSSRRRHTRWPRDWSSDVCSSDLQLVALRPTSDVHQGGKPVESGEQLSVDCARLDDARPADDERGAIAALPRTALLALERSDATIGEGSGLGSIVSGEDNDRVVGLAHVVELLEDEADIVV